MANLEKRIVTIKQKIYTSVCIIVFLGVLYTFLSIRNEVNEALGYLWNMNILVVAAIIPTIWLMYIAAGRIWRPYLSKDGVKSTSLLARIQYELNFVNTVVPFLNVISGLAYAIARLKPLGVTKGRTAGMYSFRYLISILTKWIEIAIAMTILIVIGKAGDMPKWVVYSLCIATIAIIGGLTIGIVAGLKRIRVPQRLLSSPKWSKKAQEVQEQINEMSRTIELAFSDRKALLSALVWGMIYSFLEIVPFWIVAAAMGHPELLLQIIVASGAAIIVGIVFPTPMGIGGFDGAMILFLSGTGENVALVTVITITTRVLVLVGTTVTGIPFWIDGMRQLNSK